MKIVQIESKICKFILVVCLKNCIDAAYSYTCRKFRGLSIHLCVLSTRVKFAKADEAIEMPYGADSCGRYSCTLAHSGEYYSTIRARSYDAALCSVALATC